MEDRGFPIASKKSLAILHGGIIRRTGRTFAVIGAAIDTFHPYPLRNDDFLGINPFKVIKPILGEDLLHFCFESHNLT
jgi:hypothetical protein